MAEPQQLRRGPITAIGCKVSCAGGLSYSTLILESVDQTAALHPKRASTFVGTSPISAPFTLYPLYTSPITRLHIHRNFSISAFSLHSFFLGRPLQLQRALASFTTYIAYFHFASIPPPTDCRPNPPLERARTIT